MEQPFVSVVMSCYNHAEFVGKAIESVLSQTYTNFEFIIVDDASEDESVAVIQKYNDSRINFTSLKVNTGFGAAEYAFEIAKGKYVAAIASDDVWKNDLLEKYIAFLEENEEYLCCFSVPEIIDENGNVIDNSEVETVFQVENRTREQWFRQLYLRGNCICAPSLCMRRTVKEQLGLMRYQYRQLQDYEYWLRVLQIGNIYIYPEKLVQYRQHNEGNNKNISAHTIEVDIRDIMERKYIMYDIMNSVDDGFFIEAFRNDLLLKPESEGFCVDCEKYAIMLNSIVTPIHASIFFYFEHYKDEIFRYHLENFYHVHRRDMWKLTGMEHDRGMKAVYEQNKEKVLQERIIELEQQLYERR